jgi:hypothetical protein
LRTSGRPVRKAAALSLVQLRQLLATCDGSARGRRDRALLLFGFAGAPAMENAAHNATRPTRLLDNRGRKTE